MIPVVCLEDGKTYYFTARTPYEAIAAMLYYLNISRKDPSAIINKTNGGMHLWIEHCGKTYSVYNRRKN